MFYLNIIFYGQINEPHIKVKSRVVATPVAWRQITGLSMDYEDVE